MYVQAIYARCELFTRRAGRLSWSRIRRLPLSSLRRRVGSYFLHALKHHGWAMGSRARPLGGTPPPATTTSTIEHARLRLRLLDRWCTSLRLRRCIMRSSRGGGRTLRLHLGQRPTAWNSRRRVPSLDATKSILRLIYGRLGRWRTASTRSRGRVRGRTAESVHARWIRYV